MRYVATEDKVSFFHKGKFTTILKSQSPYFDKIKESIQQGKDFLSYIPNYIKDPETISNMTNGQLEYKNRSLQGKGFKFPDSFTNLLKELLDSNLPIVPLVNLCKNLSHSEELSYKVGELIFNQTIPISWDGNLVTYARSSWVAKGYELEDWMNKGFIPHEERENEEGLITGSFEWVMKNCPDQGRVFDLLVQPQHILSIKSEGIIRSRKLRNISTLEETTNQEGRIVLIKTETSLLGKTLYLRSPFSDSQLSQYIASRIEQREEVSQPVSLNY